MDMLRNSYENEDKENEEPEILEQFQASSLLDCDIRDSFNPALKEFDGPSNITFPDGRPVDISTYDPSGYLASPDGSLIMIRKANSGRMSPVMGKSVKDYEEKMKVLRQENFDLRLYCYHLEQKLKDETVCKDELSIKRYTVQLETEQTKLQQQLSNKNELLKTASSAIDSLKSDQDALQNEVQQLRFQLAEQKFSPDSGLPHRVQESGDLAKLEESNAQLRQRLASSETQIKELANQLAESRRSDAAEVDETRWSQSQAREDFEEELQRLNQKYERAVKAIQGFIRKVTKRDKEIESLKKKLAQETGKHFDAGEQDSGIKQSNHSDSSINTDKSIQAEDDELDALKLQIQILQNSLDTQKDELQASLDEADALRNRLSEAEESLAIVLRDLEKERMDRRHTEEALRQQEADRETQLANLQAALAVQEAHINALTNRTEGASSTLAGYEAVVADRSRQLEEVLATREHALAEAAVEVREMGRRLMEKQDEVDCLRSQQTSGESEILSKNLELKERLHKTEKELTRLRDLLRRAEEGLEGSLDQASELLESRDRSSESIRGERSRLSASAGGANVSTASQDAEERDPDRSGVPSPGAMKAEDLSTSNLHAEVARLRGLLMEKEEKLERMGTPHRGVARRLFTLHALPAAATQPPNNLSASVPAAGQLSTSQLQNLHSHIYTLLQTLERTQHLQESFFGDLLATANESLLQHQQQSIVEPVVAAAAAEESVTSVVDQSIASLSGLSFLLNRLPRTPGGLQGGNVTMTTEGVTMTEEMHELIFERLRDQVDSLRSALAMCSEQGHSLLQETVGMGSPMRLTLDSEDWSALLRRLLQRLEREEKGSTDAVHKDVRLAVGLCRQIIRRLDRDEQREGSPVAMAASAGLVNGALSTSDLLTSPDQSRESKAAVVDELSRTVGVVRTRCHALESENRELRQRLDLKDDSAITFVSPFSSGRRSRTSGNFAERSGGLGTDHESIIVESITGLERERSALESELSRFREMLGSSHNLSASSSVAHDNLLDSQVEDVTARLRAMQLDLSVRMKDPDTPRHNKSLLRRETEEARRRADHLARDAHDRELECEKLRSTAADLRRQVVSRCDDLEMARLRSELAEMQQRYSIQASDLELEVEKCGQAMRERERLIGELALVDKEREAMQLEIESAREATRRLEAELGSERSRLCQEIAELSEQVRLHEAAASQRAEDEREEIHGRIFAIRAQMTQLEAENTNARARAEAAERRLMEITERESCQRKLDDRMHEELSGRLEQQRNVYEQELDTIAEKASAMEALVSDLMSEKQSLLTKLDHLQSQFRSSGMEAEKLASEFTGQVNEMEAKMASMARERDELHNLLEEARQNKAQLDDRSASLTSANEDLERRLASLTRTKEESEVRVSTLMRNKEETEGRLTALIRNEEELEARLTALTASKKEQEGKVRLLLRTKDELETRLSALIEDKDELEGKLTLTVRAKEQLERQVSAVEEEKTRLESELAAERLSGQELEERVRSLVGEDARRVEELGRTQAQVQVVEQQCRRLEEQVREMQSENVRLQSTVTVLEEEKVALGKQLSLATEELESESSRWKTLVADLRVEAGENEARREKEKADLQQENERLHEEMTALNAEQERLSEENEQLGSMVEELKKSLVKWQESMKMIERRLEDSENEVSQKDDSLTDLKRQFEEAAEHRSRAEVRVEMLEREIDAMRQSFSSGSEETRTLLTLKSELERRLEETVQQLTERDRTIEVLKQENAENTQHLERIKPEVVNLRSNLTSVNKYRAELKSSLERLQNNVRSSLAEQKAALTSRGIDTSNDGDHRRLDQVPSQPEHQEDVIDLQSFEAELQKAFTRINVLQESLEQQDVLLASREADLNCIYSQLEQARAHAVGLETQLLESNQFREKSIEQATEISQLLDRLARSEDALQGERDLNSHLKTRVHELELEIKEKEQQLLSHETARVPSAKDLRETGQMVHKLEGRVHDLLTENQRWKSAAKELRSKLDTRTTRLESCLKQNARLKALIKQDEQQAEDRRADLETLTNNVQHKNDAISRLQLQLKTLQREVECSHHRAVGGSISPAPNNMNNSALPSHLTADDISYDSSSASGVSKEGLRRAATSGIERPLTPALSDVLSGTMEDEVDGEEGVAMKALEAKLRATEYMNQSLRAELSVQTEPSPDRNENWVCAYLDEIRLLRSNLEASIAENDRLRAALERQLGLNGSGSSRHEYEIRRLRDRLALKKRRLQEMEERVDLANGEVKLLKTELEGMKELVRSCKAELELCRPRSKGSSVRREMVLESQRLRLQMERSIESNRQLHVQLKEQLGELKKRQNNEMTSSIHTPVSSTPRVNLVASLADRQEVPTRLKTSHCDIDHQSVSENVRVDSDFRLLHAIGRLDDFELVRKEVKETLCLMHSIQSRIDDRLRHCKADATHLSLDYSTLKDLESDIKNIIYYLEEEDRIMGRFWVAELPPRDQHGRYFDPAAQAQLSEAQVELERLRGSNRLLQRLLSQQEQRMADTHRARNDLECAIVERLSSTEHVLSAARDNFKRVTDNSADRMNKTS